MVLKGPRGTVSEQLPHENAEVVGEYMHQITFSNIIQTSQGEAPQSSGFEEMSECSFHNVGAHASQSFAVLPPTPRPISVKRTTRSLIPVPASSLLGVAFRNVRGDAKVLVEFANQFRFVVAFICHRFPYPLIRRDRLQSLPVSSEGFHEPFVCLPGRRGSRIPPPRWNSSGPRRFPPCRPNGWLRSSCGRCGHRGPSWIPIPRWKVSFPSVCGHIGSGPRGEEHSSPASSANRLKKLG